MAPTGRSGHSVPVARVRHELALVVAVAREQHARVLLDRRTNHLVDNVCRRAAAAKLLDLLPDIGVEIETNGTTKAPPRLDVRIDQFNVSPKLSHSGNPAELALIEERLDAYATDPRAFFKFVVASEDDVAEAAALVRRHAIPPARVFLMPEGTDSATLRAREEWLVPLCLDHGFRLSDRLHIHLFGDTRGT